MQDRLDLGWITLSRLRSPTKS